MRCTCSRALPRAPLPCRFPFPSWCADKPDTRLLSHRSSAYVPAAGASSRKADHERGASSLLGSGAEYVPTRVEICADTHTLFLSTIPLGRDGIERRALRQGRGCNTVRTRAQLRGAVDGS